MLRCTPSIILYPVLNNSKISAFSCSVKTLYFFFLNICKLDLKLFLKLIFILFICQEVFLLIKREASVQTPCQYHEIEKKIFFQRLSLSKLLAKTYHYNPSVRITAQLLTPLMLCGLILYVSDWAYNLTSKSNDFDFFVQLFHGSFIILQSYCQKSAKWKSQKKYFFSFFFSCLT